jgi:hypothetical protein
MDSFIVPAGFLCQKTDQEEHKELLFCSETHIDSKLVLPPFRKYRYDDSPISPDRPFGGGFEK